MNRLSRITAILTQLQSKRVVKAKEMADRFEVSLRTIYRDIKTLQEAGVPIGGQEGVGYFLVAGYQLPPVSFTEEEANALILAEQLVNQQGDHSLQRDYETALFKIKAILRSPQKEKVNLLAERISPAVLGVEKAESHWLADLQKAITNSQLVHIKYYAVSTEETTERLVEPLALSFTEQAWYLLAFCRLRQDIREFRLDRIQAAKVTEATFQAREDFNMGDYYREH